eukprot:805561-Prymnesium_polylepis.1
MLRSWHEQSQGGKRSHGIDHERKSCSVRSVPSESELPPRLESSCTLCEPVACPCTMSQANRFDGGEPNHHPNLRCGFKRTKPSGRSNFQRATCCSVVQTWLLREVIRAKILSRSALRLSACDGPCLQWTPFCQRFFCHLQPFTRFVALLQYIFCASSSDPQLHLSHLDQRGITSRGIFPYCMTDLKRGTRRDPKGEVHSESSAYSGVRRVHTGPTRSRTTCVWQQTTRTHRPWTSSPI